MARSRNGAIVAVLALTVVVIMVLVAMWIINAARESRADLPVLGQVPEFELTERTGVTVTRDSLMGKISVVTFGFTRCKGPCPIMTANMAELYETYDESPEVQLIFVSVDPENDTEEVLRQYALDLGVRDDRWLFLRGPIEDIVELSESGFHLAAEGLPGGHSTKFVLVDPRGNIRGYYSGTEATSLNALKTHIRSLAREME